jgi:IS5 family transposase
MDLPAKSSRLALGAPILSERLDVTDRVLGAEITAPPYRQYFFLGLVAYQEEAPFQRSLLTIFRNWSSSRSLAKINDALA